MTPITSFAAAAGPWQNFYILTGTAAATLIGLVFVAATFGASLVTKETTAAARSFIDPTVTHFVQVLLTACLVVIPSMTTTVVGVLLMGVGALRLAYLVRIYRHMREAHRRAGDIELSDWLTGIAIPAACYLVLAASGAAFQAGYALAFDGLAIVTVVILLNGVYGAWELVLWMAVARSSREK